MPASAPIFSLRIGGKIGPASGQPVNAVVTVTRLKRDCWQGFAPAQVPLGDCAAIRLGGIEIVLISNRTLALGIALCRNVDIEPTMRKLVVVWGRPTTPWGPSARPRRR